MDAGATQDVGGRKRGNAGRGWRVWAFVAAAVLVDLLAAGIMTVLCAVSENQTAETQDYCDAIVPNVALAGIPVAVMGAVVARFVRRDWPWAVGVSVALAACGHRLASDPLKARPGAADRMRLTTPAGSRTLGRCWGGRLGSRSWRRRCC